MKKIISIFLFTLSLGSCTNLDEELYDKLPVEEFGQSEKEINSLIAPIYRTLKPIWSPAYFCMVEGSSDMAITPTRKGGDGWEGGLFKEFRFGSWTSGNRYITDSYNSMMTGVSTCNQIINMIENNEGVKNKEQTLAEIRAVRALWYYFLIDNYGNVPIVTDFTTLEKPSTSQRKDVYEFIIRELLAVKDLLREDVSSASYGKMTKGAALTLLAKMYLNASIWNPTGGTKWEEVIKTCDEVLKLDYILEPDWKKNFLVHNETSKEIIFPIVFSTVDGGNIMLQHTLHYLSNAALGLSTTGFNGINAMPNYVHEFDDDDRRKAWSFLTGPMYNPNNGELLITAHGRPLIHHVDFTFKYSVDAEGWGQVEQEDGARCYKWEFEKGVNGHMENDYAIFRLADIYLMKAEALIRSGRDEQEATALVNNIRKRAFINEDKLLTSVTLQDIYKERRFEFAWELFSRQDMIRFGTFLEPISGPIGRKAIPASRLIYPIPRTAIDANPKLTQNPDYQ
ncbi:RagB/SusD family nutrient uptake outer membrane protein [Sphingobacterium sp. UT-1RO-CII-1]|uniref:RagB/SusD family nutrient uptake outer membrane protein n=1 Tax=Sphingobacterium sp. UT-1RO-CII-1 TaxID=2995225 RepID=UPI00227C513F|nr:RagB/SusD family nutrient uptake outer membrane protein [Sphingobacterium sp. UT-1RO-CII-1]MCY4778769.1 RagB/SusD family nutrient uptake outer membrane protein [Sphingobacterium sp. UT-1RO-CII-1]